MMVHGIVWIGKLWIALHIEVSVFDLSPVSLNELLQGEI